MSRVRKLSPSGDYLFGNSLSDFYINEPAVVGQNVETRLLLWLGEWYLDISQGTPYMQGILGKYSQEQADTIIQDEVLSTDGVVGIQNYQSIFDPDNRQLSINFNLDTIYGPTEVQIANYANY